MSEEERADGRPIWSRRAVLLGMSALALGCASTRVDPTALPAESREDPPLPTSSSSPSSSSPPNNGGTVTEVSPPAPALDEATLATRYRGLSPRSWGTDLPGLLTSVPAAGRPGPRLALTFDACGGPGGSAFDAALLELLTRENIAATLFLNERWITANPLVVAGLMTHPLFDLANHGTRHVPLSITGRSAYRLKGTSSPQEVIHEVASNQDRMTRLLGQPPKWFRAGTAYYDDVAVRIVADLGITPVGFAVNGDAGGTASLTKIKAALLGAPDRAVVLMHMNRPAGATRQGLVAALPELRRRGTQFVTLAGT